MSAEENMRGRTGHGTAQMILAAASVVAAAIAVRASIDFAGPLVPKANGAYYLVQVRALFKHAWLAFPDEPLVFLIEALVARVITMFGVGTDRAITLGVKLVDTVLPALAAVPAFVLAKRMAAGARVPAIFAGVAAACWVALSFSPVAMTGDFQKNAVGMLWFLCLAASVHVALSGSARRGLVAAAASLALAGLTHVGALGVSLAFAGAAGVAWVTLAKPQHRRLLIAGAVGLLAGLAAVYLVLDPRRLARLVALPVSLFRRPHFAMLLAGRVESPPSALVDLLLVNAVAIAALVLLVRRWHEVSSTARPVVIGALATSLFLASPLLGTEWAERFHLMAYAPAVVVVSFLLAATRMPARRRWLAGVAIAAALFSSFPSLARLREPAIPPESYEELEGLRALLPHPDRTLLIARHGLEWWAAWVLRTRVTQEFDVAPSVWSEYESVCFLRFVGAGAATSPGPPPRAQSDQRPPAPPLARGPASFPEVRVPDDVVVLHRGRFFELSRGDKPPSFYPLSRPE